MLLTELYNEQQPPVFAWFEPCDNTAGVHGVHLVFVKPLKTWYDRNIADAENRHDPQRAARLRSALEQHLAAGRVYDTPEIGWWPSKEIFDGKDAHLYGGSKEDIVTQYPTLQILKNKGEAVKAAKQAGLF